MAQKKFLIDGGFQVNDDSVLAANLEMSGHITPSVDSDGTTGYDLGSPTNKWRDLYLSQGSLYIDGQKVLESDSGTIVVKADADQSLTVKTLGTGVLTLQSDQTVNFAATMQMAAGKRITSADGLAVVFGDKVDMDANQIINVGAPTADGHVATKLYVDTLVGNIATDAITEGDSQIEIADLGTGTVGIIVDGAQRFALSATSLALTVPVTVNGVTLANTTYVDTAEADAITSANAYTDGRETAITTAYQAYTDGRETAITTAYQAYADAAEADATTTANAYTDTRETAITTAYQAYADAAEVGAVSTAAVYTDARETAITTAYQSYANAAEADAITSANSYTDSAISTETAARNAAIASATATLDAEILANETAANTRFDTVEADILAVETSVANILSNTDSAALDSLTEIVTAFQTADSSLNGAITTLASDSASARASLQATVQSYADTGDANTLSSANTYTDAREAVLAADISSLETAVAGNDTDIAALNTAVAGNDTDIAALQSSVSTLSSTKLDATANAVSASKWATARIITLAGDATGSVSIDGSANVSLTVTVADDSHNHVISNVDGLQAALDAKADDATTFTAGAGLTGGGTLGANRTFNVGAGTGIIVAADSVSVDTTWSDARYVQPADLVNFHSATQTVTSTESVNNATGTVNYTFADLATAKHVNVFLNRMLLRPTEFTVSGSTLTISLGVLATDDELEVSGLKLV